jgi:hypothetical protein
MVALAWSVPLSISDNRIVNNSPSLPLMDDFQFKQGLPDIELATSLLVGIIVVTVFSFPLDF